MDISGDTEFRLWEKDMISLKLKGLVQLNELQSEDSSFSSIQRETHT